MSAMEWANKASSAELAKVRSASEQANGRASDPVLTSGYPGAPSETLVKLKRKGQSDGPMDDGMEGHMDRWTDGPTDGPKVL